jgi:hypothetical protein
VVKGKVSFGHCFAMANGGRLGKRRKLTKLTMRHAIMLRVP